MILAHYMIDQPHGNKIEYLQRMDYLSVEVILIEHRDYETESSMLYRMFESHQIMEFDEKLFFRPEMNLGMLDQLF